jgi:hypothetical protein
MLSFFFIFMQFDTSHMAFRSKLIVSDGISTTTFQGGLRNGTIYMYEKNMKTGSSSWTAMLREAKGDVLVRECRPTTVLNALQVYNRKFSSDVLIPCHTRRMSIPRSADVRIITSFNLEKDMVTSAFLQRTNRTIDELDRTSEEYISHKRNFNILWSLDYMGYTARKDSALEGERCPVSPMVKDIISVAVMDTYLPISHDLPCISHTLLERMVGIEILSEVKLNVRNGKETPVWELEKSCVDIELTKGLTVKLLDLYDGTQLDISGDWRNEARQSEMKCSQ